MNPLNIGLSSWIIQDGNYEEFSVGEIRRFALEFNPNKIEKINLKEKAIRLLRGPEYHVKGEVVFLNHKAWILDFGVLAYQEHRPPKDIRVGDYIETRIYLGVDHFAYFERLNQIVGIPELIYTWSIEKIEIEANTDMYREAKGSGFSDPVLKEIEYEEIKNINCWKDSDGKAEYVLTCRKSDMRPTLQL